MDSRLGMGGGTTISIWLVQACLMYGEVECMGFCKVERGSVELLVLASYDYRVALLDHVL